MRNNILFDLDGTIIDPALGITEAASFALAKMGREVPDYDTLTQFIGPPLDEMFREVLGFSEEEVHEGVDAFRDYFGRQGITEHTLYPGMEQLFAALKNAGRGLYVATTKPVVFAKQILEQYGLSDYFTEICGSQLSHAGSPKGQVIAEVLEKGNIAPDTCIMVGDRRHDVIGASQHGIPCVGVLFGYGSEEELKAAGAKYVVEDVPALQKLLLEVTAEA